MEGFREKVRKIQEAGVDNLNILTDFDATFTKQRHPDGKKAELSFLCVVMSKYIKPEDQKKIQQTYKNFFEYERTTSDDAATRSKKVGEMYMVVFRAILENKLRSFDMDDILATCSVLMRLGVVEFIHVAARHKLPFYIVSAGFVKMIDELLRVIRLGHSSLFPKDAKFDIIANKLKFEENTHVVNGWYEPIIHTRNKLEVVNDGKR